jgi:hypothetical protein
MPDDFSTFSEQQYRRCRMADSASRLTKSRLACDAWLDFLRDALLMTPVHCDESQPLHAIALSISLHVG